jgi:hypothetical protein
MCGGYEPVTASGWRQCARVGCGKTSPLQIALLRDAIEVCAPPQAKPHRRHGPFDPRWNITGADHAQGRGSQTRVRDRSAPIPDEVGRFGLSKPSYLDPFTAERVMTS